MRVGSLTNLLEGNVTGTVPTVGQGATRLMWTDRKAGTIVEVNGKRLVFQEDTATRADHNGMSESQQYTYAPDPQGHTVVYTLRKNGAWVREGQPFQTGERLGIGYRDHYHDYSF
jgi:hypothetical protein